jgi:hypothetical protein
MGTISCASARICMSVGNYRPGNGTRLALAEQWNGTSWVIVDSPVPTLDRDLNSYVVFSARCECS